MSKNCNNVQSRKKTSIGGQALIEGIMMRGPEKTAMAVRHVSGEIILEEWPTKGKDKPRWMKLPFIRGIFNMVESMAFGYKCLMRSAELCGLEEEEPDRPKKKQKNAVVPSMAVELPASEAVVEEEALPAEPASSTEVDADVPAEPAGKPAEKKEPSKAERFFFSLAMVVSMVLGIGLAILLFMWLPTFLYNWLRTLIPALADGHRWFQSVFEGIIRLILFIGYISLVSLMKDIRRVFMYHGAEHKSIFCYEAGLELTVENVRKQSRFHPRCGTSFMVLMLIVGVFLSMLIPIYDNTLLRVSIKLLMLPLVVGIGYELIKLAGRKDNTFTRVISKPGMWVQRITTKEPDDSMIECAIAALEKVIPEDPDADNW